MSTDGHVLDYCRARRECGLLLLKPQRNPELTGEFKKSFQTGAVRLSDKTWELGPQARHHPHLEVLEKGAEKFLKAWGYQCDFTPAELELLGDAIRFAILWRNPWGTPSPEQLAQRLLSRQPLRESERRYWARFLAGLASAERRQGRKPLSVEELAWRDFEIIRRHQTERAAGPGVLARTAEAVGVSESEVGRALDRRRREGEYNSNLRRIA